MESMVLFLRSNSKELLLTLILLTIISFNFLPQTQTLTTNYIDRSLERAVVSFTIAKGLNAIISVAQGTEVAATPAGIGVNFAVGELLDPINDMVERFSWVMLASSVSLGIQKILVSLLGTIWVQTFLTLLLLLLLYAFLTKKHKMTTLMLKIAIFVMILRFCLPIFALINQNLYSAFLEPSYAHSTQALQETSDQAKAIQSDKKAPNNLSLWGKIKQAYKSTAQSLNIKSQITQLTDRLNQAFTHMLTLITIFIIETIIFPLLFLYFLLKIFRFSGLSTQSSDTLLNFFRTKISKKSSINLS
jgi:hypothetical protein